MRTKIFSIALAALSSLFASAFLRAADLPASLEWDFSKVSEDRVLTDLKAAPAKGGSPAALVMDCSVFEGGASARAVTFHIRTGGDNWSSAQIDPSALAAEHLRLPLAMFAPAIQPGALSGECDVRVSVWRAAAPGSGKLKIDRLAFAPPAAVAVVTGASGSGMEALARRVRETLTRERLDCDFVATYKELLDKGGDSAARSLAIVPDASTIAPGDAAHLLAFIRGGGKAIIYYCSESTLAEAFGLRPGQWRGGCSYVAINPEEDGAAPYPHRTDNTITPRAASGSKAKMDARFITAAGRLGEPAVMVSPVGAWFSHIPPLPSPAASRHLASLVRSLASSTGAENSGADKAANSANALNEADFSGFGIRAAWLPAAPGFPGGINALPAWMQKHGLKTLFARLSAFGSDVHAAPRFLATARRHEVSTHIWVNAFKPTADGKWTIPHGVEARSMRVQTLLATIPTGFEGVQLDYVRAPEGVEVTPDMVEDISLFVRAFVRAFRRAHPGATVSAAVFPTPAAAASRGQDWPRWVKEGWVDFVSPMIYAGDPSAFERDLALCRAVAPDTALVPGIAACADEASPDAASVRAQLKAAAGCRGVSFYALDWALGALLGFTEYKEPKRADL